MTLFRAAFVCLLLLAASLAFARDLDGKFANSPLKLWFDTLVNKNGALCCSDADGTVIDDPDWESSGGHYRVRVDGKWWDVPDENVVTVPNLKGRTMVWPARYHAQPDGEVLFIRCFMPGPMT